jgi:hypothetical protein
VAVGCASSTTSTPPAARHGSSTAFLREPELAWPATTKEEGPSSERPLIRGPPTCIHTSACPVCVCACGMCALCERESWRMSWRE